LRVTGVDGQRIVEATLVELEAAWQGEHSVHR
jgi:hypothetical protein